VIGAQQLGKKFGPRWVFRGLTFNLSRGDRLVIVGRNGSGKSTLLRSLAGLLTPSEGKVTWDFGDYRTGLGYAALEMSLYGHLTSEEHLSLSSRLRNCESRTAELLERVGLVGSTRLPVGQLSTGQRARLKLALAIQPRPSVLLLDEPGASLDEDGRNLVSEICEEQTRAGCLIVATNMPEERRMATLELELV
jgi:ABC-type multidrug transport system ATPase subunit